MAFPVGQLDRILTFFAAHLPRFRMSLRADGVEVEESVEPRFILTIEGGIEQHQGAAGGAVQPDHRAGVAHRAAPGVRQRRRGRASRKLYRRREEQERDAGKLLLSKGFKFDAALNLYEAHGGRGHRAVGARALRAARRSGSATARRRRRSGSAPGCARASGWG